MLWWEGFAKRKDLSLEWKSEEAMDDENGESMEPMGEVPQILDSAPVWRVSVSLRLGVKSASCATCSSLLCATWRHPYDRWYITYRKTAREGLRATTKGDIDKNVVKVERVVPEICSRTDRRTQTEQTDRHAYHNTPLSGGVTRRHSVDLIRPPRQGEKAEWR